MAGGGPLRPRVTLMPFEVVMAPAQPEPDFERMGREGFEPSTLGLRVRPDKLQRTTRHRNPLERGGSRTATNYVPRSLWRQARTRIGTRTEPFRAHSAQGPP